MRHGTPPGRDAGRPALHDDPPPRHVLIVAAGHPAWSDAAADLEAARTAQDLRQAQAGPVMLLTGAGPLPPPPGMRLFQPHTHDAIMADAAPGFDETTLTQHDLGLLHTLGGLLRKLQPDVAHLHDLAPFGVEFLALLRREVPVARIMVSLGPDLARRVGMLGGAEFLHTALMRRFLREADAILLPCESLRAPALAFGLEAARLHLHATAPAEIPARPRRWLLAAAFPRDAAQAAMVATAALMLAELPLPGPRRLRLELHGPWGDLPEVRRALDLPGSPLALGTSPLAAAHLALVPAVDVALRAEATIARCPALDMPPHAPALAEALLDLLEQPARLDAALAPAPSPAMAAAALLRHYRP